MILKVVVSGQTKKLKLSRVSLQELTRTIALATQTQKTDLSFTVINLTSPLSLVNEETFSYAVNRLTTEKPTEQLKVEVTHKKGLSLVLKSKDETQPQETAPVNEAKPLAHIRTSQPDPVQAPSTLNEKGFFNKAAAPTHLFQASQLPVSKAPTSLPPTENSEFEELLRTVSAEVNTLVLGAHSAVTAADLLNLLKCNRTKFSSFLMELKEQKDASKPANGTEHSDVMESFVCLEDEDEWVTL